MKAERGFTLIELMVVVAIIGIIAAVGYPAYTDYIVRSHRAAAQSLMQVMISKQEEHRLNARNYTTDIVRLGLGVPGDVAARYDFELAVDAGPPMTNSVVATPKTGQAEADAECGTLTLSSTGEKSQSGSGTDCWR